MKAPLAPADRERFVEAVTVALQGRDLGDGAVYLAIRKSQRRRDVLKRSARMNEAALKQRERAIAAPQRLRFCAGNEMVKAPIVSCSAGPPESDDRPSTSKGAILESW